MFFGKSKRRKSNIVDSPEYNEYIETDNLQDALDLFKRIRKHGFEPADGINKLRWSNGTDIFDFKKPFGPGVEAYDIPQAELDKLIALLDARDQFDAMPLETQDWLVNNPNKLDETISKLGLSDNITNAMKKIFNEKLKDLKDPYTAMMDKGKQNAQKLLEDYSRYGVSVPVNDSELDSVTVINRGDKLLNTYPGLVKNNRIVFFPNGKVPSDALDDYEEDSHSDNYWTLKELKDMKVSPEGWKEFKQQLAEDILNEKREANKLSKKHDEQYRGADGNYDVSKAMNDIFGE